LVNLVALIPLTELSDPGIEKKYGVKPDAETLDIVNTIARQKEVSIVFPYSFQYVIPTAS